MGTFGFRFLSAEHGNASVGWVVLVGGIVGLTVALMLTMSDGLSGVAKQTGTQLDKVEASPPPGNG